MSISIELREINRICRICLDNTNQDDMFRPCRCNGNIRYVHKECLDTWRNTNPRYKDQCQTCLYEYKYFIQEIKTSKIYNFLNNKFFQKYSIINLIILLYSGIVSILDNSFHLNKTLLNSDSEIASFRIYLLFTFSLLYLFLLYHIIKDYREFNITQKSIYRFIPVEKYIFINITFILVFTCGFWDKMNIFLDIIFYQIIEYSIIKFHFKRIQIINNSVDKEIIEYEQDNE
jgi:hypothetical protein